METKNLQLTAIEKRPLVGFIATSKVLYLKHIKLVWLSNYYFGVSVCVLILSSFIMRLITWKVFSLKTATQVIWKTNALKNSQTKTVVSTASEMT